LRNNLLFRNRSWIRSDVVIVYFRDRTEKTVREALADGSIPIRDLNWLRIEYYRDART